MKPLTYFLYGLAVVLLLLALIALSQVFTAGRMVANFALPFQMMFGGGNPVFEQLMNTVKSAAQTLFIVLTVVFLGAAGLTYAVGRLLRQVERQKARIHELEEKLGDLV